ncbi:hypothetical protein VST7929_02538 [Vibrio stylophorae]|uniref:Pilus assembly protein PilN n=1 Tax=Vibrio stylophorae TaxID=659351 RepID=A0ABM8ZW76_9VIBR|nr:PilN domain-containing protein [Vibrio stylophorae]CAH0534594.1 hypothetical protein VST7929_02538 [Vibrio stylophorae]
MLDINLMPWREAKREKHKKRFMAMLGIGLVISALTVAGSHFFLGSELSKQNARVDKVQVEIDKQNSLLSKLSELRKKREELQQKIRIVSELQNGRNRVTVMMNLLPEVVPAGVYMKSIQFQAQSVGITGVADSKARLSTFLKQLEESPYITGVTISTVQATEGVDNLPLNEFQVAFQLKSIAELQHLLTQEGDDAAR